MEFNQKRAGTKLYLNEIHEAVKVHEYDLNTIEVVLARWTG